MNFEKIELDKAKLNKFIYVLRINIGMNDTFSRVINFCSFAQEMRKSAFDDFPGLGSAATNILVARLNVE